MHREAHEERRPLVSLSAKDLEEVHMNVLHSMSPLQPPSEKHLILSTEEIHDITRKDITRRCLRIA